VDLVLSDDQRAVQLAVREWVAEVVTPDALRNDREERFPQEALDGPEEDRFRRHVDPRGVRRWGSRPADLLPVHRGAQPR
jgi:hypothetical protein